MKERPVNVKIAPLKMGIPLKVLLWFAHDPDDKLTTSDMATMYGVPNSSVACKLRYARVNGLLKTSWTKKDSGMHYELIWTAGPKLRELIGEVS